MTVTQHALEGRQLLGIVYTDQCAGADVAEGYFFTPDYPTGVDYIITKVIVVGDTALTGTATNYASIVVQDGGAAGTGTTAVTGAAEDFDDGTDMVAGTPITLTASAANRLDAGDVLRCRVTKTALGAFMGKLAWHIFGYGA